MMAASYMMRLLEMVIFFSFSVILIEATHEATEQQIMDFVNVNGNTTGGDEYCFCNTQTKICTCHLMGTDGSAGIYE
jgi:hypothetical protein